jgi:hypothetical protein
MILNRRLTVDLRPAMRRMVSPAKAKDRRHWCPSCEVTVEPQVDSGGLFCPWCQTDIPTAMERGREHTT